MAIDSRANIKLHFETGDVPTESNFIDWLDSFIHKQDDGVSLIDVLGQKRLGIGTSTPAEALEVIGAIKLGGVSTGVGNGIIKYDAGDILGRVDNQWKSLTGVGIVSSQWNATDNNIYYSNLAGNVGIGTPNPEQKLYISGNTPDGTLGIGIKNEAASQNNSWLIGHVSDPGLQDQDGRLSIFETILAGNTDERLTLLKGGKLGIGIIEPKQKLEVAGAIKIGANESGITPEEGTIRYSNATLGTFDVEAFINGEWVSLTFAGGGDVESVNGQTGVVSLTTANISEVTNLYFTNARAIGSALTGYASGAGTINASDSILGAIQKLNGNIGNIAGSQWTGDAGGDIYVSTGRVGIGATSPDHKLHLSESKPAGTLGIKIQNTASTQNRSWVLNHIANGDANLDGRFSITQINTDGSSAEHLSVKSGGKFGLGVTNPAEKLEVSGSIKIANTATGNPAAGTITFDGTNFRGKMSSTAGDWKSFNNSVDSVNGQAGAVSLSTTNISEGSNLYHNNARVIASTLTGYASGAGTISSSDTVLSAIQKLNGNIAGMSGSQWTDSGGGIYYSGAYVGIGSDVLLKWFNHDYGAGAMSNVLEISVANGDKIKIFKGAALADALTEPIEVMDPGTCNMILENMRTRIDELESRLRALNLIG